MTAKKGPYEVRNTDDHRRTWPDMHRLDGSVLVLDPAEHTEIIEDPAGVAHLEVQKKAPAGD